MKKVLTTMQRAAFSAARQSKNWDENVKLTHKRVISFRKDVELVIEMTHYE
jgi:hypothetical protein